MPRIEICGGIGVGKSTVARAIADYGNYLLVTESYRENPYWTRFARDPDAWVEAKNLAFLRQHAESIAEINEKKESVCDFALVQDLAYAKLVKSERHQADMKGLYVNSLKKISPPRILLRVHCSEEQQFRRIQIRGRKEESNLSLDYIKQLNSAIHEVVMNESNVPIMNLDSENLDFRSHGAAIDKKLKELLDSFVDPMA